MDDGGKSVYNQTILHTRAFTLEEVKYLQSVLHENFGLITRTEEKKNILMLYIFRLHKKLDLKISWLLTCMKVCYIKYRGFP